MSEDLNSEQSTSTPETPSIYDHLAVMLDRIAAVAWSKMGLQPDMISGKFETELEEARIAIDVVNFLVSKLEPQLDEADRRQIQSLVRDLKINFVQKQGAQ